MGITTKIEWCDSTLNAQMGCDGCELWNKRTGEGTCYAATLTERYGGKAGWPRSFGEPAIFPERIAKACAWSDLTGTERPDKPWLNGYPRLIFLDDMGDTWTESLPIDWLAPYVEQMAASPHIYMALTKRARRMRRFWESYGGAPKNFWLMVSVTSRATLARVDDLIRTPGGGARLVSYEPMLEEVDFASHLPKPMFHCPECGKEKMRDYCAKCGTFGNPVTNSIIGIDGIIFGGESGSGARPTSVSIIRHGIAACRKAGVAPFVKQLGAQPFLDPPVDWYCPDGYNPYLIDDDGRAWPALRDRKGGDPEEWPADLRVRELPNPPARQMRIGEVA